MKIQIGRLLLLVACALLATETMGAAPRYGQTITRGSGGHVGQCGGMVVSGQRKHEKKEPVILSYRPDRTDHFLFARDAASRNMRDFDWTRHREEYVKGLNRGEAPIRVTASPYGGLVRGDGKWALSPENMRRVFYDGLLKIESPEKTSPEWRRMFFEAASWRYPQDGTMRSAKDYFENKVRWTRQALCNGSWDAEPLKVLEAAVGVLTEVAEWSFRKTRVPEEPQQSAASFSFGMPEAAVRKAEEAASRQTSMRLLCDVLRSSRLTLAEETWEKCNLMLGEAYKRQDRVALERLHLIKKRILGSLDDEERKTLLNRMPPADRPQTDEAPHVVMRVRMESKEFIVGEPVAFVLEFNSAWRNGAAVFLGGDGVENLRIELSDGNTSRSCIPSPRRGVSSMCTIVPTAGQPKSVGVLLHDFSVSELVPGRYQMTVSVVDNQGLKALPPPEGTRWVCPGPAQGSFQVVEASEDTWAGMQERLARWSMASKKGDNDPVWKRWQAREAILLSRHSSAWVQHEAWMRHHEWEGDDELRGLVKSLVDSGRVQAVRTMIAAILDNPEASSRDRLILCDALRQLGALEWKDERAALLAPWEDEIRGARPLTIDD